MDINQLPNEGEIKVSGEVKPIAEVNSQPPATAVKPEPKTTANPTAKTTETDKPKEENPATTEPAEEMTAEQFELYNSTLRRVSKTTKGDLPSRYNAFEDVEVRAMVKQQIMAGEKPDIKGIAATVVTRLAPKADPVTETKPKEIEQAKADNSEVQELRAELALVKAGIVPERLEAAKKLFIAEGGDPAKATEFVQKYPEWQAGQVAGGVTFVKAQPVNGKTAPNPSSQPVLNDFERKVMAARQARGLPT